MSINVLNVYVHDVYEQCVCRRIGPGIVLEHTVNESSALLKDLQDIKYDMMYLGVGHVGGAAEQNYSRAMGGGDTRPIAGGDPWEGVREGMNKSICQVNDS